MKAIAQTAQQARRKRLYVLLRVANNDMAARVPDWDDDDYRNVLKNHGAKTCNGRISATTMSLAQLDNALRFFKTHGFKPRAKKTVANWRAPRIAKLNAMWCALADNGHLRDRSEQAMQTWCVREVNGLTRLQWATSDQLNTAVEMLKRYLQRCGVDTTVTA